MKDDLLKVGRSPGKTDVKRQVAHLSAAAAGAGEKCDWDPSRFTGGRVRSRVVE